MSKISSTFAVCYGLFVNNRMKRKVIFVVLFAALMMGTTLQAQKQSPSIVGGEDSLSRMFSREFTLDTPFVMNHFSFLMQGTVTEDGSLEDMDGSITSSYTVYSTQNSAPNTRENNHVEVLLSWVKEYLRKKIAAKEIQFVPCTEDGSPVAKPIEFTLTYAPLYYAQTGDTLSCTGEIENAATAYGERPILYHHFYVHNGQETPYHAVVHRNNQSTLTLHYFDTLSEFPFLIARYKVEKPDQVVRNSFQQYMSGKRVQYRQYYEADSMRYVEMFDEENKLSTKYFMVYRPNNLHPHLLYKEVYYPSGNVKTRIVYPNLLQTITKDYKIDVYAYREDGTAAKYVAPANAKSVVSGFFKRNFRVPRVKESTNGINSITVKPMLVFYVDAEGNMEYRGKVSFSTDWSYNYQVGITSPVTIRNLVQTYYGPCLHNVLEELRKQTLRCKPAKIDKQPVESIVLIKLEHEFTPR